MPSVCLANTSNADTLAFMPAGQDSSAKTEPLSLRGRYTKGLWIALECECLSLDFSSSFVALYWKMTEWERSHRDKGEGGQIEQGQARKGSR